MPFSQIARQLWTPMKISKTCSSCFLLRLCH